MASTTSPIQTPIGGARPRIPELPEDIIALILSPSHNYSVADARGIPLVSRLFYSYGLRLLWSHGLQVDLGTPYAQPQLEAMLDQPKVRPLIKHVAVKVVNTAADAVSREERAREALTSLRWIGSKLDQTPSLSLDFAAESATEAANLLNEILLVIRYYFRRLTSLSLAYSGTTHRFTVDVDDLLDSLSDRSLAHLSLSLPLVFRPKVVETWGPLELQSLSLRNVDDELVLPHIFLITGQTLRSLTLKGADSFLFQALEELSKPGLNFTTLAIYCKSPSLLFNHSVPSANTGATNDLYTALASVLPFHPSLQRLVIGPNNIPSPEALNATPPLQPPPDWAHQLAVPLFWSSLPPALRELDIMCVLGRKAEGLMNFLEDEKMGLQLRVIRARASLGRAVVMRARERGIQFETR